MAAFRQIVERYQSALYRYVSTYVGVEDIDDILQFVWLQCYRSLVYLQENQSTECKAVPDSLKSWLFRVATNRCIDEIRKKRRRQVCFFSEVELLMDGEDVSMLSLLPDSAPLPEVQAEAKYIQRHIYTALCSLPEKYRMIIWLRYTKDLSYTEIGLRLQMPANTVKTCYYRGCLKLRSLLSSDYDIVA